MMADAMVDVGGSSGGGVVGGVEGDSIGASRSVLGKRAQVDDSNDFDRFSKRLHLLSIGGDTENLYVPVNNKAYNTLHTRSPTKHNGPQEDHVDSMHVEATRDRVFIHDLDEELADTESDEERLIFLPDIEKRLSRLPKLLLSGRRDGDSENQEMVLYSVPRSLTVDESQDSVRKAILETRQRAREKAAEQARHEDMNRRYKHSDLTGSIETAHGYGSSYVDENMLEEDLDSMEID